MICPPIGFFLNKIIFVAVRFSASALKATIESGIESSEYVPWPIKFNRSRRLGAYCSKVLHSFLHVDDINSSETISWIREKNPMCFVLGGQIVG